MKHNINQQQQQQYNLSVIIFKVTVIRNMNSVIISGVSKRWTENSMNNSFF